MFVSLAGSVIWKPLVMTSNLTNGLKVTRTFYKKDKDWLLLLDKSHSSKKQHLLFGRSSKGYMTRNIWRTMLEQLNKNAMTMDKKYALCVDGLSSHFLYFDTFKEWKNDKKRDANDVIFTDTTTYSNLHLFYFAPSTTSICQPLDGGAFCWLQAKYRAWLNNYLITNNEKPVKKDMIEFVFI